MTVVAFEHGTSTKRWSEQCSTTAWWTSPSISLSTIGRNGTTQVQQEHKTPFGSNSTQGEGDHYQCTPSPHIRNIVHHLSMYIIYQCIPSLLKVRETLQHFGTTLCIQSPNIRNIVHHHHSTSRNIYLYIWGEYKSEVTFLNLGREICSRSTLRCGRSQWG